MRLRLIKLWLVTILLGSIQFVLPTESALAIDGDVNNMHLVPAPFVSYGGVTSMSMSHDGRVQAFAVEYDRQSITLSTDYGATFHGATGLPINGAYTQVAISGDGQHIVVAYAGIAINESDYSMYISDDSGTTWRSLPAPSDRAWTNVFINQDASKLAAINRQGNDLKLWTSVDGGITWTEKSSQTSTSALNPTLAGAADGSKLAYSSANNHLQISNDWGDTWVDAGFNASVVTMGSTGTHIVAANNAVDIGTKTSMEWIYQSSNGGSTFSSENLFLRSAFSIGVGDKAKLHHLAISDDGKHQLLIADNNHSVASLYYSTDHGVVFTKATNADETNLSASFTAGLAMSGDGHYALVGNGSQAQTIRSEVPTATTNLQAVVGNKQISLTWTPGTAGSGSPVTDQVIQYSSDKGVTWHDIAHTPSATQNSLVLTDLTNGQRYRYRISGRNVWGYGNFATTDDLYPGVTPWAPRALTGTSYDSMIDLEWSGVVWNGGSPITGFQIQYSTDRINWHGSGSNEFISVTNPDARALQVNGLTNGVSYWFRIRAVNQLGAGYYMTMDKRYPAIPKSVPSVVRAVAATYVGNDIDVTWAKPASDGGDPITGYQIDYVDNWTQTAQGSITIDGADTLHKTFSLPTTNIYVFYVFAINSVGTSSRSNFGFAGYEPDRPINVAGTEIDSGVQLSWTEPDYYDGPPANDFKIEYSADDGTNWSVFNDGVSSATSATVSGLTNGAVYKFRVSAINQAGASGFSNGPYPYYVPKTTPSAPSSLVATAADGQASLSWSAPSANGSAITNYLIEYSSDNGTTWNTYSHTASTSTSIIVTGLTNYKSYLFRVSGINSVGTGPTSSNSDAANPGAVFGSISLTTPGSGVTSGAAFTTHPQISILDEHGAVMTGNSQTVITATVSAGGTLVGTKSVVASAGIATFSTLGLSGVSGTAYTITYSGAGFTDSQTVTATTGSAYKLMIMRNSSAAISGRALATQPILKVTDIAGNTITGSTATIDAVGANADNDCTASTDASKTAVASSGIATYSSLAVSGVAGHVCTITYSSSGLQSISENVNVGFGTPSYIFRVNSGISMDTVDGRSMPSQPVYKITDNYSNTITTDNSTVLTVTLPGATITQETVTAVAGIFTFTHLGFAGVTMGRHDFHLKSGALDLQDAFYIVKGDPVLSWETQTVDSQSSPFAITAPTSNAAGTYSYSSSNTSVLTISSNTGTVAGVGSSTVTATFTPTDTAKFNSGTTITKTVNVVRNWEIAASADAHSSISPSGSTYKYTGTNQSYTFAPSTGYSIETVTVDGAALSGTALANALSSGSYTFSNITAAHTIAVTSKINTFTVFASAGDGGSIAYSGTSTLNYGASSSLYTITKDSGYSIATIAIDSVPLTSSTTPTLSSVISSGYQFTSVDTDHLITVSFSKDGVSTSGVVPSLTGLTKSQAEAAIRLAGFSVGVETATASGANADNNGKFAGTQTLVAGTTQPFGNIGFDYYVYTPPTFPITVNVGSGGISPSSGTNLVRSGTTFTFKVTPLDGYIVDTITPSAQLNSDGSFSISNITSSRSISVSYLRVSVPSSGGGGGGGGGGGFIPAPITTPTPTPSSTESAAPTPTPQPSESPTKTPTPVPTASPTPTPTPSPSQIGHSLNYSVKFVANGSSILKAEADALATFIAKAKKSIPKKTVPSIVIDGWVTNAKLTPTALTFVHKREMAVVAALKKGGLTGKVTYTTAKKLYPNKPANYLVRITIRWTTPAP